MTLLDRRALLLSGAALAAAGPVRAQVESLPLADPSLAERVKRSGVPALGYAVVGPEGLRACEVSGLRRNDRQEPVAREDPWSLAAAAQPLTSALYARLVEQGRAAWRAKLPALFPGVRLDPAWADARIDDLLAHRSGISDRGLLTTERLRAIRQDARPVAVQRAEFAAEVLGRPPAGQPDAYEPSLAGYVVAGAAIERLAGTDWESALTLQVLRPLGMDSAGFGPADAGADGAGAPLGHELAPTSAKGRALAPVKPGGLADYPPLLGPAGRVHASLPDWAKFCRVFLAEGAGFLSPSSLTQLAQPWGGADSGEGLGWRTEQRPWADGPVLSAEGSNGFWRATALIAPARGLAVLTTSNADAGGGAEAVRNLSLALTALYTGVQAPRPKKRRLLPF